VITKNCPLYILRSREKGSNEKGMFQMRWGEYKLESKAWFNKHQSKLWTPFSIDEVKELQSGRQIAERYTRGIKNGGGVMIATGDGYRRLDHR
jgi:hypothetical protein